MDSGLQAFKLHTQIVRHALSVLQFYKDLLIRVSCASAKRQPSGSKNVSVVTAWIEAVRWKADMQTRGKKTEDRLRELARAARDIQDAESRNLPSVFYLMSAQAHLCQPEAAPVLQISPNI